MLSLRSFPVRSLCLSAAVVLLTAVQATGTPLRIYHFDVEQGDATLIMSPVGRAALVDAGANGMGADRIVPRLLSLGVQSLDYIVVTHYDADHVGGVDEVVGAGFRPLALLDRGTSTSRRTKTYRDFSLSAAGVRRAIVPGEQLDLGGGVHMTCVA
ncbi:ComEC/Rec2 family competence protein, partial [Planctomycetota bacterium]